jgi:hypothetical protein
VDPRSILREQIEELQRRLSRIEKAITAPAAGTAGVEERLLERVRVRFERRLLDQGETLGYARQMVLDQVDLAECWDVFRPARDACQPLLAESLAVLEGALARSARLDDGFCDGADGLIAEISKQAEKDWSRFTILNEGELYTNVADVIRIRFPSAGVWDLPIAAHECGHFVSTQVWERDATGAAHDTFQEFLVAKQAGPGSRLWYHLNEHFADVFATFAVGPAYGLTALLLRFDASRPDSEDDRHPSPAKRAYLILQTLTWMDRQSIERPYAGLIRIMRELWPPPDLPTCVRIDGYLDDWLCPMLKRNFPLVRYRTWPQASVLAGKLGKGLEAGDASSLRDVLNAAWLARVEKPDERAAIEQAAAAWCMGEPEVHG